MSLPLKEFLDGVARARPARVVLETGHVDDGGPCLHVGCGRWPEAGAPQHPGRWLLNNKGTGARFGRDYSSVTALVTHPPDELARAWASWAETVRTPDAVLAGLTLVVEDASPDSVFGVLLLLARLVGVTLGELGAAWGDAVDDWERTGNADEPWTSWCALASALAHSHFPPEEEPTPEALTDAWADALGFAALCLQRSVLPHAVPTLSDAAPWRRATAALRQEHATYLDWLSHAAMVQLSLPLTGTRGRRLLVDALLFVEDQPTGTAKVFYRNDRERSPLGQGFAMAVHHRPSCAGTGNDITITVDPRLGLDLRELWAELEMRESAAWRDSGEERLAGAPRSLTGVDSRHDEPWYITPDGTLIGAPKRLSDGRTGSKLGWSDVRDAVWTACHPLWNVQVCSIRGSTPACVWELPRTTAADHDKTLLVAHWPGPSDAAAVGGTRALSGAPITMRVLAALLDRQGSPGLDDLPGGGAWERLDLAGGFAIVTDGGLFLLDDWRERPLAVDGIRAAFEEAARLDRRLKTVETEAIRPLVAQVRAILDAKRRWPNLDDPVRRAALAASRLTEMRGSHALPPGEPDARLVRDALDRRWSLDRRLTAMEAEVKAIEAALRSLAELRLAGVGRFIALFAFPLVVADVFGSTLGKTLYPMMVENPPPGDPPAWVLLSSITGIWLLATAIIACWLWKNGESKA